MNLLPMHTIDEMKNAIMEGGIESIPHVLLITCFATHCVRIFFNTALQYIFTLSKYVTISEDELILAKTKKGE